MEKHMLEIATKKVSQFLMPLEVNLKQKYMLE